MTKRQQHIADLLLLFVTCVWGASFILMKRTVESLAPSQYLAIRFILASIILFIIFFKRIKTIKRNELLYGFIIGIFLFLGMILQVIGLQFTYASKSAFITGLTVVLVPIFVAIIFRKLPKINVFIGVILAFFGIWLLNGAKLNGFNLGDTLTFISDLAFVAQIIAIDVFTSKKDINSINTALIQISTAAVLFTAFSLFFERKPLNFGLFNTVSIITILVTGVLGTALAFTIQVVVQKYTTPTHTALIFSAEPVFGAIFASIIPSSNGQVEILSLISYIGCFLILLGNLSAEFEFKWSEKR
ncbi:DMT family transporter [Caldicellulosiruptoraceae bacterium PP1]